ncbi:hypothetical protein GGR57DRAFT_452193 [Xylariaceae sp. FL1272]|nr:hypothetical protein GGR57DRAFT_452193 [Xylariaceae sp. FL1272]
MGQNFSSSSSFGIELEFLVAFKYDETPLITPERFRNSSGGPIWVDGQLNEVQRSATATTRISETISRALQGSRLGPRVKPDLQSNHLTDYQGWTVGRDNSVYADFPFGEEGMEAVDWESVEISSPALYDSESSWDEVFRVVEAISDDYWIITPNSAGMHVHYGNGGDYIPVSKLNRIAALCFAADPLLATLYPNHRKDNTFSLSNRLYSIAAHGITAETINRDLGLADNLRGPIPKIPPAPARRTKARFKWAR